MRLIARRYRLLREIGRGGMGAVWLARDETLGREVALKRIGLLPGSEHTDVARGQREARLAATLHHPNVVTVYDVAHDEDGSHWLVMEYVEGQSLAQILQERGTFAPEEAAPILRDIATALVAAHHVGIAHRDVKPSNVLIDNEGRAKLADFGIAHHVADPTLTQTGVLTGSPSYLAPEVATGARGSQAGDVWSLGATAYHLLAGRPPFENDGNVVALLYKINHEDPPSIDAGWLTALLGGTLVKDPTMRWSMPQALAFLSADSSALPPGPHSVTTSAPMPARSRWSAAMIALACAVGVALVAGLGAIFVAATSSGSDTPSASGTRSPDSASSGTPTPEPTVAGMEAFIRDYVRKVAEDPATSWPMLTAKFQRESGGFATYDAFWTRASNGQVRSISADPANLTVSYQVHFDTWNNGPGPTVLDLVFDGEKYQIDGEHSAGFTPAD